MLRYTEPWFSGLWVAASSRAWSLGLSGLDWIGRARYKYANTSSSNLVVLKGEWGRGSL